MRFYSLSAEIQAEKDAYYDEIERAQRGTLDVTRWLRWFLGCHRRAVDAAEVRLKTTTFAKATAVKMWKYCRMPIPNLQ